jgi:hypothetical protein
MIRSIAALGVGIVLCAVGLGGPAAAAATSEPVVSPIVSSDEISHDGRYLWPNDDSYQVVDRLTGGRSAVPACNGDHCWSAGFVRDNPSLVLTFEYGPRPDPSENGDGEPANVSPLLGVFLTDTSTGARLRIDSDSSGAPLVPAWRNEGSCGNEWCDNFYDYPQVFIGTQSVSRNGRKVAFCTNYAQPKVPLLFVKDLSSGRLTRTGLRCPVMDAMGGESTVTATPEISADGRVVHVNGDLVGDGAPYFRWTADTLYFTRTGGVRTVSGWGSMTRNGVTMFMRLGVPKSATARSRIRVGAYSVKTRKVLKLSGRDAIYGTPVQWFDAYQQASYRGRFVVGMQPVLSEGTSGELLDVRVWVVDRSTGAKADIGAILRERGYRAADEGRPIISGDGRVLLVRVITPDPERTEMVAITGWEPTARATVTTNPARSKLIVNVDPDKGSGYWTFRVQAQRTDGSWRTLKRTYRTQGSRETRTIDLPAGTYRVRVQPKSGYLGSTSAEVILAM